MSKGMEYQVVFRVCREDFIGLQDRADFLKLTVSEHLRRLISAEIDTHQRQRTRYSSPIPESHFR